MKEILSEQMTFRLTDSVHKRFMAQCKNRRLVDVLREAIDVYLKVKESGEDRETGKA